MDRDEDFQKKLEELMTDPTRMEIIKAAHGTTPPGFADDADLGESNGE